MIGIYKITNTLNGKMYIGQSVNVEKRLKDHKNPYNWAREYHKPLYQAFKEDGIKNFIFEIIEQCKREELDEKEIFWINHYDACENGYNVRSGGGGVAGDNHPLHKLTEQDVRDIRTKYNNHERRKEVYQLYKDKIGESGFGKIWKGESWQHIMPEVYTPENKDFHLHNTGNSGSSNGRSRLTEKDVRAIRLRRKNGEKLSEVYKDYQDFLTKGSFTNVWSYQNWKNIIV